MSTDQKIGILDIYRMTFYTGKCFDIGNDKLTFLCINLKNLHYSSRSIYFDFLFNLFKTLIILELQ